MTAGRTVVIGLLAMVVAGAAPEPRKKSRPIVLTPPDSYPIPPVPPRHQGRFQVAPVPNGDVTAPLGSPSSGPQFRPDFFPQKSYNGGQGYIPGSSIEGQQEQRLKPIPGFNLKMPLQ